MKVRVSAVNFAPIQGAVTKNTEAILRWIRRLESYNRSGLPHFILFPELSLTGPVTIDGRGFGGHLEVLEECRRAHGVIAERTAEEGNISVLAGSPVLVGKELYIGHTAFAGGKAQTVRLKSVLGPGESEVFSRGDALKALPNGRGGRSAECLGVRFGVQLCLETHYPEIASRQAEEGAAIIFCAFASPREKPREKHRRLLRYLPARGYDNSCFVVWCNLIFRDSKGRLAPGTAGLLDPKGRLVNSRASRGESYIQGIIDLGEIERIRASRMGFFRGTAGPPEGD